MTTAESHSQNPDFGPSPRGAFRAFINDTDSWPSTGGSGAWARGLSESEGQDEGRDRVRDPTVQMQEPR